MKVEREAVAVVVLIALVVLPLWYFALTSATTSREVVLDQANATIAPTETFLPAPAQIDEYVAGVVVWIGLFVLVAMIFYTHQFVRTVGQAGPSAAVGSPGQATGGEASDRSATDGGADSAPDDDGRGRTRGDGGAASASLPSFLSTGHRRVIEYWPATFASPGMVGLTLFAWAVVVFAALFSLEALSWSRRQYLGVYGGMLFLSLGVLVAVYATWFLPSVLVAEDVDHGGDAAQGDRR